VTHILLVEDSDEHADIVTRVLTRNAGWTVTRAMTGAEALLQAARAADADGKEDVCFSRLREVQALVSGGGG
jgi:CheY-like chemotaxis protein